MTGFTTGVSITVAVDIVLGATDFNFFFMLFIKKRSTGSPAKIYRTGMVKKIGRVIPVVTVENFRILHISRRKLFKNCATKSRVIRGSPSEIYPPLRG